jgi:SAM-dependent methyltransferase
MLEQEFPAIDKTSISANSPASKTTTVTPEIKLAPSTINYNRYFTSGTYTLRYPRVNTHTLQFVNYYLADKPANTHVLDYGCGDGRYLTFLLSSHSHIHFTAFDIAIAPLNTLREKLEHMNALERVAIVHDFDVLLGDLASGKTVDIALLLFGVLSHIDSAKQRHELLCYLRESIATTDGKLILSVPNKARRFLALQQHSDNDDIRYTRKINHVDTDFFYHLYDVHTIEKELADANLQIVTLRAESFFPESWVTRVPLLGYIDRHICQWLPARWGYGILICCQPKPL